MADQPRAGDERVGFKPIYDYVLHEWWEDWDTPAAEGTANAILDALRDAGFRIMQHVQRSGQSSNIDAGCHERPTDV